MIQATAPTATRPRISASLEALRVRVVKKADGDDDDDDDDDDSFDDVDLKLEVRRGGGCINACLNLPCLPQVA